MSKRSFLHRTLKLERDMRRPCTIFCVIVLFFATCAITRASSVGLVKEGGLAEVQTEPLSDDTAIVLTFGDERVVIYDPPLSFPDSRLLARDVSLSELFVVRDRRPVAERTGYETIYSHSGFKLAIVKNPQQFADVERVRLRPVTGNRVVTRAPKHVKVGSINPAVETVLGMLNSTQYKQYMSTLVQNQTLKTRNSCSSGQLTARDTISSYFKSLGLTTNLMKFANDCAYACQNQTGFDVIGIKEGLVRPQEYYLVGAHYDSTSGRPCKNAPGANDNASGMAGVLELARVFSQLNTEASIIFVGFSGEEEGLLGSRKYSKTLVNSGMSANIKAFVMLDMISYYKDTRGILIEGSNKTSQQSEVLDRLVSYGATYTNLSLETTTDYGDSDHEPFLNKGMAGALLIESDWSDYNYYHTTQDLMRYQKIGYGLEVVKLAAAMLAEEAGVYFSAAEPAAQ